MNEPNSASQYFNNNWKKYQETIKNNTLCHREMAAALNTFLIDNMAARNFTLVDVGCGDGSTIIPVLIGKSLTKYIGIDGAAEVLKLAENNFSVINSEKEFICDNMVNAIAKLPAPVDVIFTSYAVHHLSRQHKIDFIQTCQNKLGTNGYLIMIDGVLKRNQTRDEWLEDLSNQIKVTQQLTPEELHFRMQHPRKDDFPEEIATFEAIAKDQLWRKFEVLVDKEIYAFMVFAK
jgi:cyclopropane fatty-acyl-phospholipid synthase-like methyltransferase